MNDEQLAALAERINHLTTLAEHSPERGIPALRELASELAERAALGSETAALLDSLPEDERPWRTAMAKLWHGIDEPLTQRGDHRPND